MMVSENTVLISEESSTIKDYRLKAGYSQTYVANKLNISQVAYSNIEKGKNKEIGLYKAILLAEILNVYFDELFPSIKYKAKQDCNLLKEKVALLESENEQLTEFLDSYRYQRDRLKTYTYLENLISLFEICDMDSIYEVNPEINEEKNVNYFAVLRFFKKYGAKSHLEIVKYLDIEKFKKTSNPNLVLIKNENNELMSEDEIIEWVSNERKKLLKMNPE